MLLVAVAAFVQGQGAGLGCPPPDPVLLSTTKSGVLPVLPTPFSGVETLEGAIIVKGPPDPALVVLNLSTFPIDSYNLADTLQSMAQLRLRSTLQAQLIKRYYLQRIVRPLALDLGIRLC